LLSQVDDKEIAMTLSPLQAVRGALKAYVEKDRETLESLLDRDYHFTSPIDNALDRKTYFEKCWPNSTGMDAVTEIYGAEHGVQAFVVYELRFDSGKRIRNCEVHTVRNGKMIATEVYFGWDVPHPVPAGEHRNP
jgi:hypothetical protein